MDAGPIGGPLDPCPRPGMRVVAVCDLPTGNRGHAHVDSGTEGEIVHTPAHFSTSYSIRFDVRGTPVTLHRISRHEFHLVDRSGLEVEPGFPPTDRYPQAAVGGRHRGVGRRPGIRDTASVITPEPPPLEPFPDDWRTAMCIAAHPDDLEYGTAGAVAAWTRAGKRVTYLLVTSGEAGIDGLDPAECGRLREAEERTGAAEVGVESVEFLGYPDGVVEYGLPLRRDIARAIRRRRPDLVVAANPDPRPAWGGVDYADHRAVNLAVVDGMRDAGNRWVFRELLDEGLEPWKVRYTALAMSSRASHAVDVTDTIEASVASLNAHRRYLKGLGEDAPDVDGMLRGFAQLNAPRFGGRLTVAYELLS